MQSCACPGDPDMRAENGFAGRRPRTPAGQQSHPLGCASVAPTTQGLRASDRQVQLNVVPFALGHATPNAVRLVHRQGVLAAGHQRRALQADRLGVGFTSGPCGPTLPLRVKEIRTGHAATRGMQLPVPNIRIRPRKASSICQLNHSLGRRVDRVAQWSRQARFPGGTLVQGPDVVVLNSWRSAPGHRRNRLSSGPLDLENSDLQHLARKTLEFFPPSIKTKIKLVFAYSGRNFQVR